MFRVYYISKCKCSIGLEAGYSFFYVVSLSIALVCLSVFAPLFSQVTSGLLQYESGSPEGYILFSPTGSRDCFLINTCGQIVHRWTTAYFPGQSAYLLSDGKLLRTGRLGGSFNTGGIGGRVEILDWDSDVLWAYNFATPEIHQHHVAVPMPGGNILVLLYELKTKEEALQAGFIPTEIPVNGIWSEKLIEIRPEGSDNYELVWQWSMWDHLVQDLYPYKENFSIIANDPARMNVNYLDDSAPNPSDWLHFNSLDYHPYLDQIMVGSRHHSEIYIIDHSTTIEESKSDHGGRYGKGGRFLYRWGNPQSYGYQGLDYRQLYGQHDAQWALKSHDAQDAILIFNNGVRRPEGNFSDIVLIAPPYTESGSYQIENQVFGPKESYYTFRADPPGSFFSPRLSGVQLLDNGNVFVCEGNKGRFFIIDTSVNEIIWQYINPVNLFGIIPQGTVPTGNDVFKSIFYPLDYPAFEGRVLEPLENFRINTPVSSLCELVNATSENLPKNLKNYTLSISGNYLNVQANMADCRKVSLIDLTGRMMISGDFLDTAIQLDLSSMPQALFLLHIVRCDGTTEINSLIARF